MNTAYNTIAVQELLNYEQMVNKFDHAYIQELTDNCVVAHPDRIFVGYTIASDNNPYLVMDLPNREGVLWNPRVSDGQAFALQSTLFMEIHTLLSDCTVSISVPALDKPLHSDETWSMQTDVWDQSLHNFKETLRRLISQVAALCVNRSW